MQNRKKFGQCLDPDSAASKFGRLTSPELHFTASNWKVLKTCLFGLRFFFFCLLHPLYLWCLSERVVQSNGEVIVRGSWGGRKYGAKSRKQPCTRDLGVGNCSISTILAFWGLSSITLLKSIQVPPQFCDLEKSA